MPLYVRVGMLLACEKHLDDRIISLRQKIWVHKTSLAPPLSIEVYVPRQENGRSCIFVRGFNCASFSMVFLLDFGTVLLVRYIFFFLYVCDIKILLVYLQYTNLILRDKNVQFGLVSIFVSGMLVQKSCIFFLLFVSGLTIHNLEVCKK